MLCLKRMKMLLEPLEIVVYMLGIWLYQLIGSPMYTRYPIQKFYWKPRRLTLKSNPAIYRVGFWNFTWDSWILNG